MRYCRSSPAFHPTLILIHRSFASVLLYRAAHLRQNKKPPQLHPWAMPLFGRLGYILQAQPRHAPCSYRVEPLHWGCDFLGLISPHNAVVFHQLPAEPVGSAERGRPAPPGGRCVWGSRGQEGALRGLRGRVGSAGALPGAGDASPARVLPGSCRSPAAPGQQRWA